MGWPACRWSELGSLAKCIAAVPSDQADATVDYAPFTDPLCLFPYTSQHSFTDVRRADVLTDSFHQCRGTYSDPYWAFAKPTSNPPRP